MAKFMWIVLYIAIVAVVATAHPLIDESEAVDTELGSIALLAEADDESDATEMSHDAKETSLASSVRRSIRSRISEALSYVNLDTTWFDNQELLETKEEGKGYNDISLILQRVNSFESQINTKLENDKMNLSEKLMSCKKFTTQYENTLSNLGLRIEKQNTAITFSQALIDKSINSVANSKIAIGKLEDQIDLIAKQRKDDMQGYHIRTVARLKEIKVLHACNKLVCTEFTDYKSLPICDEILKNGQATEDSPAQKINVSLKDLLAAADQKMMDNMIKDSIATTQAKSNISASKGNGGMADSAGNMPGVVDNSPPTMNSGPKIDPKTGAPVGLSVQDQLAYISILLEDSGVPERTYVPARKIIMMIRTGAAAIPQSTSSSENVSLPESLVALLRRIADDQKKEATDFMKNLDRYHALVRDNAVAVRDEVTRQMDAEKQIKDASKVIDDAKADNSNSAVQQENVSAALSGLLTECKDFEDDSAAIIADKEMQLVNILKLRSLLRVLDGGEEPKCPKNCTDPKNGFCAWSNPSGAKTACICQKGFSGDSCERTKCPGPNGVMYSADEPGVCSRRGTCNETTGVCECYNGYYHGDFKSCEYKVCPGNGTCNDRGTCNVTTGACACYGKYYSSDCSSLKCPSDKNTMLRADNRAVCNGNGACNFKTGQCMCSSRYSGTACDVYKCPGECSGRGTCDEVSGKCKCNDGYTGDACDYKTCPNNCSGESAGFCDRNSGRCNCNQGFSGPSCLAVSQGFSALVDWRKQFGSNDRYQWASCPVGQILVGLTRTANVLDSIDELAFGRCANPTEGGKKVALNNCYTEDNGWGPDGFQQCNHGFYVAGILREVGLSTDAITKLRCCELEETAGFAMCQNINWWQCMDSIGECKVPEGFFIQGFLRTGGNKLSNIQEAVACSFRRAADAKALS